MGNTASREDHTKALLEQGALTLPLGSQVEKLFHEDFDDDAHAILTPNTPTTPALLLNDKKQKRRSWRNSLDLNKWAPVQPGAPNKRDSAHGSSTGNSTEYLSPQAALSVSSSRRSSEAPLARQVLSLQVKGRDDGTEDDSPVSTRDLASQNTSPQTLYGTGWSSTDPTKNEVLPSPIASQSSIRLSERISPQLAFSRIARHMAADAPTPNNSNTSTPPMSTTPRTSKHDSALLSEEISAKDFQPTNPLPGPHHPAKSHFLQRLAAEGGAQQVLNQARERSRSRSRERSRERHPPPRRPAPTSAARLEDLTEVVSPFLVELPPAWWQQRITKRMSDQEVSEKEKEKKRLSELSLGEKVSWLEDASASSSDRED
ncbi:hypothetical protein CLAFUR4_13091 [Fulvia fulva]|nr:hypothetical protein CLAFUR4_13091 [Fulvia fulva]